MRINVTALSTAGLVRGAARARPARPETPTTTAERTAGLVITAVLPRTARTEFANQARLRAQAATAIIVADQLCSTAAAAHIPGMHTVSPDATRALLALMIIAVVVRAQVEMANTAEQHSDFQQTSYTRAPTERSHTAAPALEGALWHHPDKTTTAIENMSRVQ